MSVFLLKCVGRNEEQTVIYDLYQDGEVILGKTPYAEGMNCALELSRPGDTYQEECEGKLYCNTPVERVWENEVKMETHFGRQQEVQKWYEGKLAGK